MTKLTKKFKIKVNDEEKTIFMSFGLLDLCANVIGDLDESATAAADNKMRGGLIAALLSEYDDEGEVSKKFNLMSADIDEDDVLNLLAWAQEHVMRFFIKSLQKASDLTSRNMDALTDLMSSVAGSQKT